MKEETKNVIRLLMEKSDWGKYSSFDSLLQDFENETKEFVEGVKKRDRKNAIEEASDVLMMMLCVIYKLDPERNNAVVDILTDRFIQKLFTRYPHLYGKEKSDGKQSEPEIWTSRKKHEHTAACMFCNNVECDCYHQLGQSNIKWNKGHYNCTSCGKRVAVSEETTLFYSHHQYRTQYINCILDSIREFVHAGSDSVLLFAAEHEKLCGYLTKELLSVDKRLIIVAYAAEVINCDPAKVEKFFDLLEETLAKKAVKQRFLQWIFMIDTLQIIAIVFISI